MSKLHTSKPSYSLEFRQQMVVLVSAGRTASERPRSHASRPIGC
jgi:hypothetical protein